LGKSISGYINDRIEKRGLSCKEVIVQNASVDVTVVESNTASYTLDAKIELQRKQHEYEIREAEHRARLTRIEIEASGLTPQQRIDMQRAISLGKIQGAIFRTMSLEN